MAENEEKKISDKVMGEYYKVSLTKMINVAQQYIKGEINDDGLNDFIDQLYIRLYIPLQEKVTLVMMVLTKHLYSVTDVQEIKVAELYKNMFFHVLLEGYAGVDCSNVKITNYESYDLLYPIFAPFLLALCKDDYAIINEMVRDSLNLYNIQGFSDAIASVDLGTVQNETRKIQEMMNSLESNKELISNLKDIIAMNDPNTHEVLQALRLQAEKESTK